MTFLPIFPIYFHVFPIFPKWREGVSGTMFTGEQRKQIDKKDRLVIPKRYRDELEPDGEKRIVAVYLDKCVQVYPWKNWLVVVKTIFELPILDPETRALQRIWGKIAEETELDNEGRLTLSREMREKAGIKEDIVLVGAMNRLELWDTTTWDEQNTVLPSAEEVGKSMVQRFGLGFGMGK